MTKSKPYYFLTFPEPPKKSVVYEVILRVNKIISHKNLLFVHLVGDQPVYTLMVLLRNENPGAFSKIISILGRFHIQCAFIKCISKRFEGSGLSDIIVSTDIIADKSVDQAMWGKHYRRIVQTHQLTYEALQCILIEHGLQEGIKLSHELNEILEVIRNLKSYSKEEIESTR